MAVTRRSFIRALGAGSAGLVSASVVGARGNEAWAATGGQAAAPGKTSLIRLDSNENPAGPGSKALEAMRAAFAESSLYPHRAGDDLPNAIARSLRVPADHVLATCGSG
ncbi:MAG: hypothetical protein EHM24_18625, partial [Acidobacteria bacterium]